MYESVYNSFLEIKEKNGINGIKYCQDAIEQGTREKLKSTLKMIFWGLTCRSIPIKTRVFFIIRTLDIFSLSAIIVYHCNTVFIGCNLVVIHLPYET